MLVRRPSEKLRTLESDTVTEAFWLLTSGFWLLWPLPVWFRLCRVRGVIFGFGGASCWWVLSRGLPLVSAGTPNRTSARNAGSLPGLYRV